MNPADNIKKQIKNLKTPASAELDKKLHLTFQKALEEKQTQSAYHQPNTWRTIMNNRVTKLTTAAAVILVAAAVIFSQFVFTGVTFAQVIKPLFEAKTIAFDMFIGGENGHAMHDRVSGNRIRRTMSNMPNSVIIIDMDSAKMLAMDTAEKSAALIDITGPLQEGTRNFIGFIRETITRLQAEPNFAPKEQTRRQIGGRRVIGYSLGNDREQVTIWADARTAEPVQIELAVGQETYIIKNFEFDIPISEDDISMTPPAGYTTKSTQMDFSNLTEKDLLESLRVWAQYLNAGMFPQKLSTHEYMNQVPLLEQKIGTLQMPDSEKELLGVNFIQGMLFLQTYELRHEGPWHYAGSGVKLGDDKTPIFWCRPKDSNTYRVIYGDLSVKDVDADNLPR